MRIALAALALLISAPVAAQQAAAAKDWKVRPDQAGADTAGVFSPMAPGWHITTGRTSAIFWDPALSASGNYTIDMEVFFFRDQSRDTEGYGLLFSGSNLDGPSPEYLYVLLRNDGKYLVRHRGGAEVHTITDWTDHPAILRHTAETTGATVKNALRVVAAADSVRLSINGQHATSYPRNHMNPEGLVGLRINHGLNLHVSKLTVMR